jgi:hypothetical protein
LAAGVTSAPVGMLHAGACRSEHTHVLVLLCLPTAACAGQAARDDPIER